MIEAHISGAARVSAGFRAGSAALLRDERRVVRKWTQLLETKIKANASGRPGPNAPTGDYRRSWGHVFYDGPMGPVGQVGTNAPQGRRLEFGFVGTDSLGRTYNQPPYEHVGPAVDETEPKFVAEYERVVPR